MLTSRKRTHLSAAGLATALTVSLCLLSGCNGARFLMGGDPTQPTTPSAQGQTPVGTASTMQLSTFTLKSKASYFGAPLANAKVSLFDAITGEPAKVISAGGGNYVVSASARSFIQVAAPSFSTDANGEFTVTYQAPANAKGQGSPVRIVVEGEVAPAAAAASRVLSLPDATKNWLDKNSRTITKLYVSGGTSSVDDEGVTAASTVAAQNSFGVLSIMKSLKTDAAVDVSYGYLVELGKLTKAIEEKITKADFEQFASSLDASGKLTDDKALRTWLSEKGIAPAMDATATAGMKSVADKFADKNNVVQDVSVTANDFVGSNFEIKIQNGQLVVVNSATGETTSFNLGNGTGSADGGVTPGTDTTVPQDGVTEDDTLTGDPNVAPIVSSASFNPTVTLSKGGSSLTVDVTQPQGSDDIAAIFARVKKTDATGSFFSGAHALSAVSPTSKVTVTKTSQTFALTLVQDNSLALTAQAGPRFANVDLSSPMWQGWLQTTGGQHIAKFGVFDNGGYYYLVTKFALNNAVTTSAGHHTVLVTNDAAIGSTANAEISIVSRRGAIVERTN